MSTDTAKQFLCTEANCNRRFATEVDLSNHQRAKHPKVRTPGDADVEPDWSGECEVCGSSPVVPLTGLCGPCTFGEADTAMGEW